MSIKNIWSYKLINEDEFEELLERLEEEGEIFPEIHYMVEMAKKQPEFKEILRSMIRKKKKGDINRRPNNESMYI